MIKETKTNKIMTTTTLKFSKSVIIANSSTKAEIEITYGAYRNVNQINTSNEKVYEAGHKFEDELISLKEMIQVLNSEGYQN